MGYEKNGYKYKPQEIILGNDGMIRFAENRIISAMLEHCNATGFDLNHIHIEAQEGAFSVEEIEQFNQLIGYSVCGFCEISCHRESVKARAWKKMLALQDADPSP